MKKLLTIVALMILGATTSFAQLGLRAGVNFDNISKKEDVDLEKKTGFHIGAVYNIDLIGSFSIEPGLYFNQKGFKLNEDDANMNYLEVPVNVKFKLLDLSVLGLDAHLGPFAALGLGGKWKSDIGDIKMFDDDEDGMGCKRFDFGLQMGIGAVLVNKIYAGINYDMSLTKIDADLPVTKDNLKETNHVWMISVGLNF